MTDILQPKNGLILVRGASKTLKLTVTAPDDTPFDLTGGKVIFTVKSRVDDERPILQKTSAVGAEAAIISAKGGTAEVYIVPVDTKALQVKQYVFDVWVTFTSPTRQYQVIATTNLDLVAGVTSF